MPHLCAWMLLLVGFFGYYVLDATIKSSLIRMAAMVLAMTIAHGGFPREATTGHILVGMIFYVFGALIGRTLYKRRKVAAQTIV